MKSKLHAIAAIACGFLLTPLICAADEGAYWTNPDGDVYKNANGECWKKPTWTKADAIMECDPDLVPKPKPKPQPVAAPKPVVPKPKPPAPRIEEINLAGDTHFEFDSAELKPAGDQLVRQLARRIRNLDDIEVIYIGGHTDSIGSEEYNRGLSMRRAQSVRQALVEEGINPDLIVTHGYGEMVPIASNDTDAGRAQNRRVEIEIRGTQTLTPAQ